MKLIDNQKIPKATNVSMLHSLSVSPLSLSLFLSLSLIGNLEYMYKILGLSVE